MSSKEKRKAELQIQLNKLSHLFIYIKESYLYAEYFHNPETKEEKDLLQDNVYYYHFLFINHILFRNVVIELAKIFRVKGNDKFTISKFIMAFKNDGIYGDLGIDKDSIKSWETELENNRETIAFILTLRDELYAHTDGKDFDYNSIDLSFVQIKKLIDLGEKILMHMYAVIFNAHFNFNSPKFERDRFPILKVLAIGEEKRKSDIIKETNEAMQQYKNRW